jgi:hypothetical protein
MPKKTFPRAELGLGLGLIGYAVLLVIMIGAVPGGSDNSGYFNEARLLAQGRVHAPMRTLAGVPPDAATQYLYVPLGFKPAPGAPAVMVPTYPPGLPLLLVPAALVAGWDHAGDLVLIVHSLAGIALAFALGRACGLSGSWSLAGAAVLAASPLYLFTSLQALSDVPATAWATAAVVAAMRGRDGPRWALVSGACVSVGFLVRPTNLLILAPVVLAVGMSPRRVALVALGLLPGVAAWMAINHAAYGNAVQSGYGAIGGEFHASLIAGTLQFCAWWLPRLLSPIVVIAPLVLAFPGLWPRVAAVLATWAVCFVAFYAPYRWTHEQWWFLRFLLPAAPALIVAGLLVARHLLEGAAGLWPDVARRLLPALVLAVAASVELAQTSPLREARAVGHGELKYGRVSRWLQANVPGNAAIVVSQASGALYYFTDFTLLRHDQMDAAVSARVLASLRAEGRPLYAVLFPFEASALRQLPGTWTRVGSVNDVGIWRRDPPAPAG